MNDDYLWDKSGKPDPGIVELEEILGTLRYQPRELEIPANVQPGRRFTFSRGLAIAAAIALVALALGVWLGFQKQRSQEVVKTTVVPKPLESPLRVAANPAGHDELAPPDLSPGPVKEAPVVRPSVPRQRLASNSYRRRTIESKPLSESEMAEARAAKDQLMMALRFASSKLNLVQKKTRGTSSDAEIHNQHKIG